MCAVSWSLGGILSHKSAKAQKKKLFVSCNGPKKNRVGRSVKNIFLFYACFTLIGIWEGRKNFRVGIFLNKNLLG